MSSAFKISTFFIVSLMTRKRMLCCLVTMRNVKLRKSCRRPSSSSLRSALTRSCEWSSGNREWPTVLTKFIHLHFGPIGTEVLDTICYYFCSHILILSIFTLPELLRSFFVPCSLYRPGQRTAEDLEIIYDELLHIKALSHLSNTVRPPCNLCASFIQ